MTTIALIAMLFAGALGNCGEQQFQRLDDVDPNMIANDPASGLRLLVRHDKVPCPGSATINGRICWNPAAGVPTAWIRDPNTALPYDPNTGDFSFSTSSNVPVIQYFNVGVFQTNGKTRIGTYAVEFYDVPAPVLIGLPPTLSSMKDAIDKLGQRTLVAMHKTTGIFPAGMFLPVAQ